MSLLESSRGIPVGLPPGASSMLTSHSLDGTPNSDVLLALLARNKALEGRHEHKQLLDSTHERLTDFICLFAYQIWKSS